MSKAKEQLSGDRLKLDSFFSLTWLPYIHIVTLIRIILLCESKTLVSLGTFPYSIHSQLS